MTLSSLSPLDPATIQHHCSTPNLVPPSPASSLLGRAPPPSLLTHPPAASGRSSSLPAPCVVVRQLPQHPTLTSLLHWGKSSLLACPPKTSGSRYHPAPALNHPGRTTPSHPFSAYSKFASGESKVTASTTTTPNPTRSAASALPVGTNSSHHGSPLPSHGAPSFVDRCRWPDRRHFAPPPML
jgi:hypothetical protein